MNRSSVLGSTCSPAEKAFKVNVACADGMLMSPATFPEVSGGLFIYFFLMRYMALEGG